MADIKNIYEWKEKYKNNFIIYFKSKISTYVNEDWRIGEWGKGKFTKFIVFYMEDLIRKYAINLLWSKWNKTRG